MSEWFQEAFQAEYLSLYAHRDEQEAQQTVALLAGVLALRPGMQVLDAPCGAGRHARMFARLGCRVTGLDLSADLLASATEADRERDDLRRRRLELAPPRYVRADLRALPFPDRRFDLVTNLFSSFGYFATDEENFVALAQLARVCRQGGHLVMDFFNAARVRSDLRPESERRTEAGWLVRESRRIAGDPPRVEKTICIETGDGRTKEFRESVRLFEPAELERMMKAAGVTVERRFGDYEGNPLRPDSPRVLLLGRRTA